MSTPQKGSTVKSRQKRESKADEWFGCEGVKVPIPSGGCLWEIT